MSAVGKERKGEKKPDEMSSGKGQAGFFSCRQYTPVGDTHTRERYRKRYFKKASELLPFLETVSGYIQEDLLTI